MKTYKDEAGNLHFNRRRVVYHTLNYYMRTYEDEAGIMTIECESDEVRRKAGKKTIGESLDQAAILLASPAWNSIETELLKESLRGKDDYISNLKGIVKFLILLLCCAILAFLLK